MNVTCRRVGTAVVAVAALVLSACSGTSTEELPGATDAPATTASAPGTTTGGGSSLPDSGLVDPLPNTTAVGAVRCDGCAEVSGIADLEPDVGDATTLTLSGTVAGATGDGVFHVAAESGQALGGAIATGTDGSFDVTVPLFCGSQLVKLAWRNDAGVGGVVLAPAATTCTAASLRVTLTWDDLGDDFELHLVRAGGTINDRTDDAAGSNDCTWTTCIGRSPDWGVVGEPGDDPVKDIDDTGSYGPENITLTDPEPIRYTVLVEHWGPGDPGADGEVIVNVGEAAPVAVPITDLAPHWVAVVASIEFPAGTVTPIGGQYDCTAEWGLNGGCGATLPLP